MFSFHVHTKTTGTIDYAYDENGNMTKDLNKDIGKAATTGVFYNHLNLPRLVNIYTTGGALKGSVVYVYDGMGNKLRKVVTENNMTVAYNSSYHSGVAVKDGHCSAKVYLSDEMNYLEPGDIDLSKTVSG